MNTSLSQKKVSQPVHWDLARLKGLLQKSAISWSSDNVPRLAAAFSFYAILSLAPVLVLAVVGAGLFYGQRVDALHSLLQEARASIGPQGADLLGSMIKGAMNSKAGVIATVFSLAVTFFSASNLFLQLDDAVNSIWGIKVTGPAIRNMITSRIAAFLGVLFFGAVVIAWLGLDSWLAWLHHHTRTFGGWQGISFGITVLFSTFIFALALKSLPKKRLQWSDVWPGAILTAFGVSSAKYLLSLYFSNFNVSAAYGSAGALVVILLWIYYVAQIYFFGVEMTCVYAHDQGSLVGEEDRAFQRS